MNTRSKGNKGEDIAAAYILQNGFDILQRNYYIRGGEIDIIYRDGAVIVFCEVKLRTSDKFGVPSEAVGINKQKRISRAALDYAYNNKSIDENFRFDIIEIYNGKINHIPNAFEFIAP